MAEKLINKCIQVIYLIGIALIAGCNTFDADFERDNTSDPKSPNFVHSKPELFFVSVKDEIVNVSWKDKTIYNDGYLVEKAIDDTIRFERFTVLPADAESFTDESRMIGMKTFYRVSSFELEDGNEKIVHSETLSLSMQVLHDVNMSVHQNNTTKIKWNAADSFIDGIRIDYKAVTDSLYDTIVVLENPENVTGNNEFEFDASMDAFNIDVRLIAFQYHGDEKVDFEHILETLPINSVRKIKVTFITETETLIEWDKNVDFADHYHLEVYKDGSAEFYEMPPDDSFLLNRTQQRGFSTYSVKGVLHNDESNTRSNRIRFYIGQPSLNSASKSLESLDLSWEKNTYNPFDDRNYVEPSKFTIERRSGDIEFEKIVELPPNQFTYTDSNLDASNNYTYRVRTLLSNPSNEISVSNQNLYTPIEYSEVILPNYRYLEPEFLFTDQKELVLFDRYFPANPVSIINLSTLSLEDSFKSGNEPHAVNASKNGNKFAEFVKGEGFGSYDVNIWNLRDKAIELTLPNVHVETEKTNVQAKLKFCNDSQILSVGILGESNSLKFWNVHSGDLIHSMNLPGERLQDFEFSTVDDEVIVYSGGEAFIYDLDKFELQQKLSSSQSFSTNTKSFSLDNGESIIIAANSSLFHYDLNSGEVIKAISFDDLIENIFVNRDGSDIIVQFRFRHQLIDGSTFESIQEFGSDFQMRSGLIALNSSSDAKAFSMERGNEDYHWHLKIWEKRPHWYSNEFNFGEF